MTMSSASAAARKRLGQLLRQRRIELDNRYRNRQRFADELGLNYKLISDIEQASRADFGVSTLIAIELAYRWQPGSIDNILNGGDPTPLPPAEPAAAARDAAPLTPEQHLRAYLDYWRAQPQADREREAGRVQRLLWGPPEAAAPGDERRASL